jgi:fibronectin-binding autotransporter adhesin
MRSRLVSSHSLLSRLLVVALGVLLLGGTTLLVLDSDQETGAAAAAPSRVCVGGAGCFDTVQAGLDAAADGATVTIGAGSFAGGVAITRDVTIQGAGAGATSIAGGGPVVMIGSASTSPHVRIRGVTITGGLATGNPHGDQCGPDVPTCGPGYADATALGGGVEEFAGSVVRIEDSAVIGNRATPDHTAASVKATCPGDVPCVASFADGAGIDAWGTMTLLHSRVTDNHAAAAQSNGGGIVVENGGAMSILDSRVVGNTASAAAPTGRFASGGGVFVDGGGALTIRGGRVSDNEVGLANTFPSPYPRQDGGINDNNALGGGVFLADGSSAELRYTDLIGNRTTVMTPRGEPFGGDAALCACGEVLLVLDHVTIANNVLTVTTAGTADQGPSGGIVEADGPATITHTRIVDNHTRMATPHGDAWALSTVLFFYFGGSPTPTMSDSVISGNTVTAIAPEGEGKVEGVGLTDNGPLQLRRVRVTRNTGTVRAATGYAHGGGIWNGSSFAGSDSALTLNRTLVAGNVLRSTADLPLQGAGIYTPGFPVPRTHSRIVRNVPDQCVGC